ncbi:twitching motility protein PilT [Caballeronia choica]|uniref:Ribonuclease VapC n=1 Tax=Caballeronia choica TaxID=326476 RepID=A0A158KSB6_9BURK|nr:type II toxin-antitoxin system VapC family toxin [Caballeronia choica]SAL84022.1 twitching motility protein PilT [Caballeronia choica]
MIVLDTHVLLWWVSGEVQLSKKAKAAIERERSEGELIVSSISAWEISLLVKRERLSISTDVNSWLATVNEIEALRFVPVDNEIALKAVELPGEFHKDPADRMIVATARALAAPLITKDQKIRDYAHVKTIW